MFDSSQLGLQNQALISTPVTSAQAKSLPIDTPLVAQVTGINSDKSINIQIGQQSFVVNSSLSLAPGDNVEVIIAKLNERLLFNVQKIIPQTSNLSSAKSDSTNPAQKIAQQVLQQQQASHLPRQSSSNQLLADINAINASSNNEQSLPKEIAKAIEQILKPIPTSKEIEQAPKVKAAIEHSGQFMEAVLAQFHGKQALTNFLGQDYKANLIKLLNQLEQYTQKLNSTTTSSANKNDANPQTPNQTTSAKAEQAPPNQAKASSTNTTEQLAKQAVKAEAKQVSTMASSEKMPPNPAQKQTSTLPMNNNHHTKDVAPPLRHALPQAQSRVVPQINSQMPAPQQAEKLLQQVNTAMARLVSTQLANINPEKSSTTANQKNHSTSSQLQVEIPIRHQDGIDLFAMKFEAIEPDASAKETEQAQSSAWRVNLAFDLAHLGPVQVQIVMRNESLQTVFWAQERQSSELIDAFKHSLSEKFTAAGIDKPIKIESHHGAIKESTYKQPQQIVSIKA